MDSLEGLTSRTPNKRTMERERRVISISRAGICNSCGQPRFGSSVSAVSYLYRDVPLGAPTDHSDSCSLWNRARASRHDQWRRALGRGSPRRARFELNCFFLSRRGWAPIFLCRMYSNVFVLLLQGRDLTPTFPLVALIASTCPQAKAFEAWRLLH
jgi:hypothetical protein